MSCVPDQATYRLLDCFAGWFEAPTTNGLVGFRSPKGLRLASTGAIDPDAWPARLTPPRLAWNCQRCEWLLVTPEPSRILVLGPCDCDWRPLFGDDCNTGGPCSPIELCDGVAVACHADLVAVADAVGWVHHFDLGGRRLRGDTAAARPLALAYAPRGELVVVSAADERHVWVHMIDRSLRRVSESGPFPLHGRLLAIRVDRARTLWMAVERAPGDVRIESLARGDDALRPRSWRDAVFALSAGAVASQGDWGFCLDRPRSSGVPERACFDPYGRCLTTDALPPATAGTPLYLRHGAYESLVLDSGIPGCTWHRIAIDADVPPHTRVTTSFAASDDPAPAPPPGAWSAPVSGLDFLIQTGDRSAIAPVRGRYLWLRIDLSGDGSATPHVRRVRIEFPRATSLEHLPSVYRESARAEAFTERFLALFDTILAELDGAIEMFPALLDGERTPDSVVSWLATWLDVGFDPRWSPGVRRRVLAAVPRLYPRRGTAFALREALRLVQGLQADIRELGPQRAWGSLGGDAPLGAVRLFGRAASRVRLGTSPLGKAPIRSTGNPDRDAISSGAFRFRVAVPGLDPHDGERTRAVRELIAAQKPAHTAESLQMRSDAWITELGSSVGIDTAFAALPAPVLGCSGNVRLRRRSALAPGRGFRAAAMVLGRKLVVGVNSQLE